MARDRGRAVAAERELPRSTLLRGAPGSDPPAELRLTLLGGFCLRVDGETVELPAGAQRLVALLALRGRTSRSRLAGTLWPDTTEHRALASLRTGLWRVHQGADRLITSTTGTVDLGTAVHVDVRRLVREALATLRGDEGAEAQQALVVLDDEGVLLPDWEDDWLLADRERLRQMRFHVLETIAGRLAANRQYGLALEAALAAVRADPLRESAHRAIIQIHVAEGNIAEARRAFDRCRGVLLREVGVEPSRDLSRLLPTVPSRVVGPAGPAPVPGSVPARSSDAGTFTEALRARAAD